MQVNFVLLRVFTFFFKYLPVFHRKHGYQVVLKTTGSALLCGICGLELLKQLPHLEKKHVLPFLPWNSLPSGQMSQTCKHFDVWCQFLNFLFGNLENNYNYLRFRTRGYYCQPGEKQRLILSTSSGSKKRTGLGRLGMGRKLRISWH